MTVTLQNPIHHATGALSTFVYVLTGSWTYDLTVPRGYKVIGILANFSSATNVDANNNIVADVAAKNVKVITGSGSDETAAFGVTAVAFAKKTGGTN
jgi:hypothetical protein